MKRSLVLAALALLALPACAPVSEDALAEEAADSVETSEGEAALVVAATDAVDPAMTAEEAAQAAAGAADRMFRPAGCATAEVQGATVTYTLNDCTGPLGVVSIDGTAQAVMSVEADGIHAAITGSGVAARGATLEMQADALYQVDNGIKTLSVTTNGSGTGPRGNSVERHGDYTITWNPTTQCATLDGSWAAEASTGRSRSTTVTGVERCADQCPSAGGEIVHTGRRGVTVTLSFDGSDAASWSTSNGKSGTVDLSCGG